MSKCLEQVVGFAVLQPVATGAANFADSQGFPDPAAAVLLASYPACASAAWFVRSLNVFNFKVVPSNYKRKSPNIKIRKVNGESLSSPSLLNPVLPPKIPLLTIDV